MSLENFDDPATIEFDLGKVPSLWRAMYFKFKAKMNEPGKLQIHIVDTQSSRGGGILVTMGEDGVKNLRSMCDKALAYFDKAKGNPRTAQEWTPPAGDLPTP